MVYYSEGHLTNMRAGESQTITAGDVLELKADGDVGVSSASSTTVLGIALTDVTTTASDERYPISVITKGIATVRARGVINEGALVCARSTGGSVASCAGGTHSVVLGRALTASTASAETIRILM